MTDKPQIGTHDPERDPQLIASWRQMKARIEKHEREGWPSPEYEKAARDCLTALWTAASNPLEPHIAEHLAEKMSALAAALPNRDYLDG